MKNLILIALVTMIAATVNATMITIAIEATIDSVEDDYGYLGGKFLVGDIITGTYTFDSETPDAYIDNASLGKYRYSTAPYGFSLSTGGYSFQTDPLNMSFNMSIQDAPMNDVYGVHSDENLPLSDGTEIEYIIWLLKDSSGSALSSDSLLITAPDLSEWDYNNLSISSRMHNYGIDAHVTSAVVVPEPATLCLLGLGVIGLCKRRKR